MSYPLFKALSKAPPRVAVALGRAAVLLFVLLSLWPMSPLEAANPLQEAGSAVLGKAVGSESKEDPNSPRAMIKEFLGVLRKDDVDGAMAYMEFPRRLDIEKKKVLARKLLQLIDKKGLIEVGDLSTESSGKLSDGLAPEMDEIGRIDLGPDSTPIILLQTTEDGRIRWRFAREFVDKVPALHEKMTEKDIEALIPIFLVEYHVLGVKAWQWVLLVLTFVLALLVSRLFAYLALKATRFLFKKLKFEVPQGVSETFVRPVRLIVGLMIFKAALSFFDLGIVARQWVTSGSAVLLTLGLCLLAIRIAESLFDALKLNMLRQGRANAAGILLPAERGSKVVIILVGAVFLLRDFGFDVTALVAGLGVGGIAVALAGQKTLENLFGGISVLLDQTVRVGDSGRFGEILGTIEDIGLRSTKVRTQSRSVLTIPNAVFAAMKLENYEKRDKYLWQNSFSLRYDTRTEQLRFIIIKIKELFLAHPMVYNDPARVRLVKFGSNGYEIDVFTFIKATDAETYWAIVEDLMFRTITLIEEAHAEFAFTTTTVRQEAGSTIDPDKQKAVSERYEESLKEKGSPFPYYPPEWADTKKDCLPFPKQPPKTIEFRFR